MFSILRCDLDWVTKRLKLESYRALAAGPCCMCPARGRLPLLWSDLRPTAAWIGQIYTRASWPLAHPNPIRLFTDVPGMTILAFTADLMHTKHMGTDMYLVGSVLYVLCFLIMHGADPAENLRLIEERVQRWNAANPRRSTFNNLVLTMFVQKDAERHCTKKMKGRAIDIRHFVPCLSSIWDAMWDAGEIDNTVMAYRQIRLALRLSTRLEDIMDVNVGLYKLPADQARARKQGPGRRVVAARHPAPRPRRRLLQLTIREIRRSRPRCLRDYRVSTTLITSVLP